MPDSPLKPSAQTNRPKCDGTTAVLTSLKTVLAKGIGSLSSSSCQKVPDPTKLGELETLFDLTSHCVQALVSTTLVVPPLVLLFIEVAENLLAVVVVLPAPHANARLFA